MEKIFYISQILGVFEFVSSFVFIFSVVALAILTVVLHFGDVCDKNDSFYNERIAKNVKIWLKRTLIVSIISVVCCTFVPSKKTYLLMVGSNVIEEISKNEKVQERTEKTLDLFDQYLEKKIKEDEE